MGLLSASPFFGQQQDPYTPYFGRRQQPQPIQYRAAQPTMPPVPQLPSLTAPPNGQPMGPDPFAPAPLAPPPMAMPAMKEGPVQDLQALKQEALQYVRNSPQATQAVMAAQTPDEIAQIVDAVITRSRSRMTEGGF